MVYSLLSGPMVYALFPCFPRKMVYTIAFLLCDLRVGRQTEKEGVPRWWCIIFFSLPEPPSCSKYVLVTPVKAHCPSFASPKSLRLGKSKGNSSRQLQRSPRPLLKTLFEPPRTSEKSPSSTFSNQTPSRSSTLQTPFHSCYRTTRPQKGSEGVSEGF